jgi:UDP-2-acetamido-3-amino-2,3-dideoxy-glucuronate N-acetyltransferase
MIGAGAVVTKNVLPYALMTGNPARQSGWVSEAGMKLDFTAEGSGICKHSGRIYKLENGTIHPAK